MARTVPQWTQPSHPHLIQVIDEPGVYASSGRSLVTLPPGALLTRLSMPPLAFAPRATYTSVQVSATQQIEFNSDFVFMNHSCDPSAELHVHHDDVGAAVVIDVRVAAHRDENGSPARGVQKGEDLTFFNPSTEWDMVQPFECNCGSETRRKWIAGAKHMGRANQLHGLFLNRHIHQLLEEQIRDFAKRPGKPGEALVPGLLLGGSYQFERIGERRGASARAQFAGEVGVDTIH